MFPAGCFRSFLSDYVEELFLCFDEVLHALAGQPDELFRLVWLAGFGGVNPGMSLLAGNL